MNVGSRDGELLTYGQRAEVGAFSSYGLICFVQHTWAGLVPWIQDSDGVQTLLLQRFFVLMVPVRWPFASPSVKSYTACPMRI